MRKIATMRIEDKRNAKPRCGAEMQCPLQKKIACLPRTCAPWPKNSRFFQCSEPLEPAHRGCAGWISKFVSFVSSVSWISKRVCVLETMKRMPKAPPSSSPLVGLCLENRIETVVFPQFERPIGKWASGSLGRETPKKLDERWCPPLPAGRGPKARSVAKKSRVAPPGRAPLDHFGRKTPCFSRFLEVQEAQWLVRPLGVVMRLRKVAAEKQPPIRSAKSPIIFLTRLRPSCNLKHDTALGFGSALIP